MEYLRKAVEALEGKKTYIVSVLLALYSVLVAFNVIQWTPEQEAATFGFLGALLGITIRAGISKV